jgi:CRP/FNR family transcriptional regulator, cyclic AMP receptor protein
MVAKLQRLHSLAKWLSGEDLMPALTDPDLKPKNPSIAITLLEQSGAVPTLTQHRRNEIIFSQGTHADTVYYLQRGRVKLSVVSKQGKEAIVAILPAGSFFGEGCLAGHTVQVATATALVGSSVLAFKKKQVILSIRKNPDFAEFFTAYVLRRKARIEEDLVDQLFNSTEKRLARVLLLFANWGKAERPEDVVPKVSQDTLARMIGTTRPRVSFFMNKFRRLGLIDYNNGLRVHRTLLTMILRD